MSTVAAATNDRTPYKVEYYKDGKKQVLHRRPPPKLHTALAGDTVTIKNRKNADWAEGDEAKVKAINPRQPNTLQLEKDDGTYTFMTYFDCNIENFSEEETIVTASGERRRDPIGNEYLLWP